MKSLINLEISPQQKGDPPLTEVKRNEYMKQLPDWGVVDREGIPRLEKSYKFPDYTSGLDFANQVGAQAEEADHHPAILIMWGRVAVSWWTHVIEGISENDFIMAARTDELYQKLTKMDLE
jgi:4a-hydroxytetrahydrobiopterin dehydratase